MFLLPTFYISLCCNIIMLISILRFWLFLLTETCCSLSLNFSLFFKYEQIKILHLKYYFGKCYKFWSLGELWMLELWSFHFSSKENFKCLFPPDFVVSCPTEFTLYYTLAINSLPPFWSFSEIKETKVIGTLYLTLYLTPKD